MPAKKETPPEGDGTEQKPAEKKTKPKPEANDAPPASDPPVGGSAPKKAQTPPEVDPGDVVQLRPIEWFDHIFPGLFSREIKTEAPKSDGKEE